MGELGFKRLTGMTWVNTLGHNRNGFQGNRYEYLTNRAYFGVAIAVVIVKFGKTWEYIIP